jgi:hypothetical protein
MRNKEIHNSYFIALLLEICYKILKSEGDEERMRKQ